jgi:hypothetical protein
MVSSVPEHNDFSKLFETCFLASLEQEERETIQFRLIYYLNTTKDNLKEHAQWVHSLPFNEPIPLTPKAIAKLAPAFDQSTTSIAVSKNTAGKFEIIGVVYYGRILGLGEIGQGSLGRPPELTFSVKVSGTVTVAFGDSVVGKFERGIFIPANPGPMASHFFTQSIIKIISKHESAITDNSYWFLYRSCIERLYTTASNEGHGGTIVWCPTSKLECLLKNVNAGVKISSELTGYRLAKELLGYKRRIKDDNGIYPLYADAARRLADYLDMVARLACVDGALIIDDELRIHRFKCHLAAEKWEGDIFDGPISHSEPTNRIDASIYGTRHNSAISAAAACDGIIVFVISEDGPVRAITKMEKTVLLWPDCLNTVFLDKW